MYRVDRAKPAQEAWDRQYRRDRRLYDQIEVALLRLEENPRHPGLRSHQYQTLTGAEGEAVWESYVSQGGAAWRIWWHYGPDELDPHTGKSVAVITVLAIGPHP